MKAKVIVGMSGGVDSSVAAWLLQEEGYQVEGLFMKNWEQDDTDEFCPAAQDLADAQAVCNQLVFLSTLLIFPKNTGKEYSLIF